MANRYLVISDLHLCDVEDHDDGWRYYKSRRFVFDEQFDALMRRFVGRAAPADALTLVLNGDVFDFDLVCAVPDEPPWPVSRRERRAGLGPTEEKSVWKLARVLDDHPLFVETLAWFLGLGHRVVYVIGNHDPELHFPGVRQVLLDAVAARAHTSGWQYPPERFVISPWFFYVPGELYAEHGQQYDYYNSVRYVLDPVVRTVDPPRIALPMGNLSNRRLMSQMGFFNPHATDFILNIFRYVTHWLKYYAFTRRGIVFSWFFGSLIVVVRLLQNKNAVQRHPPDSEALFQQFSAQSGVPVETLRALNQLKRPSISNRFYRVVREFWLDRFALAMVMIASTITLALSPVPTWLQVMVPLTCFPLFYLIYEYFAHGETVFSSVGGAHLSARRIAEILPTPVVTFGHSHHAELIPIMPGVVFVDTGTWAPVTLSGSHHALAPGRRNVLTIVVEGGEAQVQLDTLVGAHDEEPNARLLSIAS